MRFITVLLLLSLLLCGCDGVAGADITDTSEIRTEKPISTFFSLDRAIFLGDSNTAHLSTYGLVNDSNIWTGSERYLTLEPDVCRKCIVYPETGEEVMISEAVRRKKPEIIIITLGTDGALSLDREGFRLSYISLIESIREASLDTKIILQSIFPVRSAEVNGRFSDPAKANKCFERSNSYISEIADEFGCKYIDTYGVLLDSYGFLRAEYNTDHRDGYHLNRAGLSVVLDTICKQMEEK